MKYKKLTLVCVATLISVSTLFVSCSSEDDVSKDAKVKTDVINENTRDSSDARDTSVEPINEVNNSVDKIVDFNKYSDEYLVNFLNEGTEAFTEKMQITGNIDHYYDDKTDSTYYGLAVKEPTQNAICYFVNMKNGAIYGHYEGRFVVAPKK